MACLPPIVSMMIFISPIAHGDVVVAHHLRQQTHKPKGANYCLSDYIAPVDLHKRQDYIGAFAVTAGIGEDELSAAYLADGDDYNSIMVKALADRLAEVFAEYLHQQVRVEGWGYAADETLDNESLIRELYQGIRPAPGYAACPEHTEKQLIWDLLEAEAQHGHAVDRKLCDVAWSCSLWLVFCPSGCTLFCSCTNSS